MERDKERITWREEKGSEKNEGEESGGEERSCRGEEKSEDAKQMHMYVNTKFLHSLKINIT